MPISLPAAARATAIAAVPLAATLGLAHVAHSRDAQESANNARMRELELTKNLYPSAYPNPDGDEYRKLSRENDGSSGLKLASVAGRVLLPVVAFAGGVALDTVGASPRMRSISAGLGIGALACGAAEGVMALTNANGGD